MLISIPLTFEHIIRPVNVPVKIGAEMTQTLEITTVFVTLRQL